MIKLVNRIRWIKTIQFWQMPPKAVFAQKIPKSNARINI